MSTINEKLMQAVTAAAVAAELACMAAVEATDNAVMKTRQFILAGSVAGMKRDDFRTFLAARWGNTTEREAGAAKAPAFILWNRTRAMLATLGVKPDGSIPFEAEKDKDGKETGRQVLVGKTSSKRYAVETARAGISIEQQRAAAWEQIIVKMPAKLFDELRADMTSAGCPAHLLELKTKKAA